MALGTAGSPVCFLFDAFQALGPFLSAIQTADRADAASVVAPVDPDRLAMDQTVGDFLASGEQDALERRSRYFHLLGARLLFQAFQILEADRFQFLELENVLF